MEDPHPLPEAQLTIRSPTPSPQGQRLRSSHLGVAPVFFVAGTYLVIAIGRLRSGVAVKLRSLGDPSYGIYLYGFPLQQLVVWGGVRSPWVVIGVTLPAATACGYASWHLVERPVLGLGRSLRAASSSSTRTV